MLEPERIVRLEQDAVVLLDQRLLPLEEVEVRCETAGALAEAIEQMVVRGAPAIGVAAAYGIALAAANGEDLSEADRVLRSSRPTAVNLAWALDEMRDDPSVRARPPHSRRRGRPLPPHVRTRGGSARARHARADALQCRRPGDRRLRERRRRAADRLGARAARARVGRRDPAAPPGRQAHRLGARSGVDPACGDRRFGRRLADGRRAGGLRDHRRGSHRRERRHRQQDRDVFARRAGEPPLDPALRRCADDDLRSGHAGRCGDPDRGTRPRRDHHPLRRPEPRLRRHARPT